MSFWGTFAASLAINLLGGGKKPQQAPIAPPEKYSTAGYRRGTTRRGSQASQSRPAPVQMANITSSESIAKAVLSRMLRETKDQVKIAKSTRA